MKKEELKPYLRQFISVGLTDGSSCSGYVANPDEILASENEEVLVRLINGMFTEEIPLNQIKTVKLQKREDTVSIPVVSLKPGYELETTMLDEIEKDIDKYLDQSLQQENDEITTHGEFGKKMLDMREQIEKELNDLDDFLDILDSTNQEGSNHHEEK